MNLVWALSLVATYAAIFCYRPSSWLLLLPGLVPIIDFAKLSGHIFITESDTLVLLTLGIWHFKTALTPANSDPTSSQPKKNRYSFGLILLFSLLICSYLSSTLLSLWPQDAIHQQLAAYHSQWNSLRVAKGFIFAALLLPLIRTELKADVQRTVRLFSYGLCLGLAAVSILALQERLTYISLTDFASDYRITASFWEMNVGGAALDAFLTLTLPFAAWLAFTPGNDRAENSSIREHPALVRVAGLVLLLMASYALLTTFTRTTYVAAAVMAIIILIGRTRQYLRLTRSRMSASRMMTLAILLTAMVYAMDRVFQDGGYRTLAALIMVFVATHFVAATTQSGVSKRQDMLLTVLLALGLSILGLLANILLAKGSYLSFAAIAAALAAIGWRHQRGQRADALIRALWLGLVVTGALIAQHWGGWAAFINYTLVATLLILGVLILWIKQKTLWQWSPAAGSSVLIASTMLGLAVAVLGNYQMGERFSQVNQNWAEKKQHWSVSLSLLKNPQDWLLGLGVGNFPYQYWWRVPDRLIPGTMAFQIEQGLPFVRLTSNHSDMGFGEMLRLMQQIPATEIGRPTLLFRVRAPKDVKLNFEICARNLIYTDECITKELVVNTKDGQWQDLTTRLDYGQLHPPGHWYAPKNYYFALAIGSTAKTADVTDLRLIGTRGNNLLQNSSFHNGSDRWFITSDRNHLPWHAKNLFLHLLIEQGFLGLFAFSALLLAVMVRIYKYRRNWNEAPYLFASMAGFVMTGFFDSLLDVPRVALLFYLLCWIILLRPASLRPAAMPGAHSSIH